MRIQIRHILKLVRRGFQALLVFGALYINLSAQTAYAQSGSLTHEDKEIALTLANTIFTQNLIIDPNLSYANIEFYKVPPEEKLQILRYITMDSINIRNTLDPETVNALYLKEAKLQKSVRDLSIAEINAAYLSLSAAIPESEEALDLLTKLQQAQSSPDWFISNRAYTLEASHHGKQLQLATALTLIQKARQVIPTNPSLLAKEASYETNDTIAYLYLLLNNPELGIAATQQVITQGIELKRNVDGIGHIGNLAYLFEKWRDYETAAALTEIIISLSEKNNLGINSIAYLRYGQSLNNIGEYAKAKPYLLSALQAEKNIRIKLSLESQLAIALAGLGDTKATQASFKRFDDLAITANINATGFSKRRLHAQALLAVARGDAKATYQLVNTQLNQEMEQTYKRIGAKAQTQLAELENTKQRQEEREAAQQREIALKQKEIDAQQRSVMLLVSLAVSLSFITLGAIAIAAWRQRTNRTLTAAAHIAEAGDRAKTQFLAVMTHELRTPLNPIIGISGLLCEYGETQTLRDQNKIIRDAGNNLLETLNGIIDMSQMESGTLKIVTAPTDLHQIVDSLYRTHKADIDTSVIQFTCHIAKDIPSDIMLDSLRIKQSLSNLISNAIKFTQKGRIHIHVTLSAPVSDDTTRTLTLIVADTGQGVSPEAQEKLFKPFIQADSSMTRNHGGAGVGLSVTRGLARLMGGDITMNSAPGRGSEFTLTVKTCYAQDADLDLSTNRRVFIAEPSAKQAVDFSPAISIEKLKAQQSEQAKKEKKERKAERKLEKTRAATTQTAPEESPEENKAIVPPIEMEDIMPEAFFSDEQTNELEDQAPERVEQSNPSTHAFEETDVDFLELEQLLEPDSEQEFETVGSPTEYASQAALRTTPMPNPYAPAPQSVAPTAPTISIPVETITSAPVQVSAQEIKAPQIRADVQEITPTSKDAFTRQTSQVSDGAISHDQLEGLNILVVEDMLANQVVLRALLEPVGCQVTMADHGGKALETMKTQMFDVILMDIRMPVMDGIETTENIRRTPGPHQNVPIIALTADASAETNAQCLAAGADVFLTKPVIVSELFSSIRFVREKQTRQKTNTALSA